MNDIYVLIIFKRVFKLQRSECKVHLRGKYMKKLVRLKGVLAIAIIFCMVLSLCNVKQTTAYAEEATVEDTSSDQNTVPDSEADQEIKSTTEESNRVATHMVQNGIDSDQMLGKILTALNLSADDFTVSNIQAAGIKDRHFAQAVYDSVIADQDNFRYGIKIKDLATGEINNKGKQWNPNKIIEDGKKDEIISSAEDSSVASKIKLILSYFSGLIDGDTKGIRSIEGIKVLRRAWKIRLGNNQIEDISCMEQGNGEISSINSEKEYKEYFGESKRNVYIYIANNPITKVFRETDGRMQLDLGLGYENLLPEVTINQMITGKEKGGVSTPFLDGKVIQLGKGLGLSSSGVIIVQDQSTINVTDDDIITQIGDDGFEGMTIKGIKSSGTLMTSISYDKVMIHWYASQSGNTSLNEFSMLAVRPINMNLYTNVKVNYTSNGCIHLHKKDDQGNAVKGAEFNLYKCSDTSDTVIPEDEQDPSIAKVYTTDENGNIDVSGLEDGEYYFVETKVPEDYELQVYGEKYKVSDEAGKTLSFDIAGSDRSDRYSLYKEENSSRKSEDKRLVSGLKADSNGKITYDVTESGTYYLVKNDVLKVITVKKDAINLENKTRKVNAWKGDSLQVTKDDGTTEEQKISDGFYVKGATPLKEDEYGDVMEGTGDQTADQLAFSLKDTKSSPFYEATIKWTKALSEDNENTAGEMSYRISKNNEKDTDKVTYCKNLSEVRSEIQKKLQQLAGVEYRNVTMNIKYGGGYESADNWSANNDNVPATTVTNPKILTTLLKVYKEDADHKALENAEFTMYRDATSADNEADVTQITVDGKTKNVVVFDKQVTKKESENSKKAVAEFKELQRNTTYYLAETRFPTGYGDKDSIGKVYTVKTNRDGDVTIDGKAANGQLKGHVFSITLTNVNLKGLPRTGMNGGYGTYTLLAIMITTAGVWLLSKRSRKVK